MPIDGRRSQCSDDACSRDAAPPADVSSADHARTRMAVGRVRVAGVVSVTKAMPVGNVEHHCTHVKARRCMILIAPSALRWIVIYTCVADGVGITTLSIISH